MNAYDMTLEQYVEFMEEFCNRRIEDEREMKERLWKEIGDDANGNLTNCYYIETCIRKIRECEERSSRWSAKLETLFDIKLIMKKMSEEV